MTATSVRRALTSWTTIAPIVALIVLAVTWGRHQPVWSVVMVALVLAAAVLAAVHHAEVIAHRVGEPFGSLVLAVAVTVIEVALIVTLMISGGEKSASLARDTVFSAVIITCSGIIGLSLLVSTLRDRDDAFQPGGRAGRAVGDHRARHPGPGAAAVHHQPVQSREFSASQLAFAAVASIALYALFVLTQTVRHRDYFLPVTEDGTVVTDVESHAAATVEPARAVQRGPAAAVPGRRGGPCQGRVAVDRVRAWRRPGCRRPSSAW